MFFAVCDQKNDIDCLCAGHFASRLLDHPRFQDGWAELDRKAYGC